MDVCLKQDLRRVLLAAVALSLGSGAALAQYEGPAITTPAPAASVSSWGVSTGPESEAILPGDVISIDTYGAPELTIAAQVPADTIDQTTSPVVVGGVKVGADGTIVLPYLGVVKVAGMTAKQVAAYLEEKLKEDGILVDPQVSVALVESPSRMITVIGEVVKPSPIAATGHIRLLDAISACGGFTPLASHTITIRRSGDPITVQLGVDPQHADVSDIPLMSGDTVIVPRVGDVYVVGEVKTQSAIPLSSNYPITVLRAIALAGGLNYGAALSKARIIRPTADNQHVEIMLNLKKVMFGKEQDIALRSDDVLFIPANAFKASISAGAAGVAASALYGVAYTSSVIK